MIDGAISFQNLSYKILKIFLTTTLGMQILCLTLARYELIHTYGFCLVKEHNPLNFVSKFSSIINNRIISGMASPEKPENVDMDTLPSFKVDTTPYTIVEENKTKVLFPSTHDVFYNPVQQFNRDIR